MTKTITKILIANRGEIACRVIRTARKMGIVTVAVYSDADRKALHVKLADEAVHIGPSPAAESYLVIDKLIDAAKQTGADAVHPGYGFLSENPDFVRACEKAGLIFIGPKAESMEAMGLKDAAKKLMDKAGVPTTPGYHGKDQSGKLLKEKAGEIGYPVLIKAVAGGGGKGMRKVEAEKDFEAALASCQREAKSSFGNDDVLIEKYIQSPRHIEVQVFGDSHGNVVHMFERDCSLQRRHQKVIEEAPAPGMTDEVRKAMTSAAIDAAKAVDYVGAGTVEFIVDGSGKLRKDGFWFMEMNTRLQVEHPVTEMITGLDLVEWQIRVARGEKLPTQDEITIDGHAIEARLYAEDPENDFLPSVGCITDFRTEYVNRFVRFDSGVGAGDTISVHYDPMIAKVIVIANNRAEVIKRLQSTISNLYVEGVTTNAAFLSAIAHSESFLKEELSTHFIAEQLDSLVLEDLSDNDDALRMAAASIFFHDYDEEFDEGARKPKTVWTDESAWRLNQDPNYSYALGPHAMQVVGVKLLGTETAETVLSGTKKRVEYTGEISLPDSDSLPGLWSFDVTPDRIALRQGGQFLVVNRIANADSLTASSENELTASMPGKIISVNVKAGDTVNAGDPLIVMEAMKMEMTLEAPRDGVVEAVNHAAGELVSDGDVLLSLETEE